MSTILFIPWLVLVLSFPTLKTLTNEKFHLAYFAYQQAKENQIDPKKFIRLLDCESQLNKNAYGDWRSETKEFMANGIAQFWLDTFIKFAPKYEIKEKYLDPQGQIKLAAKMISQEKNGIYHWENCGIKTNFIK